MGATCDVDCKIALGAQNKSRLNDKINSDAGVGDVAGTVGCGVFLTTRDNGHSNRGHHK